MGGLNRNYPYTSLLAVLGFLIGILFLITIDFSMKHDSSEILENPGMIAGYIKESVGTLVNSVMLGVSSAIILGIVGFFIDIFRKNKINRGTAMAEEFSKR